MDSFYSVKDLESWSPVLENKIPVSRVVIFFLFFFLGGTGCVLRLFVCLFVRFPRQVTDALFFMTFEEVTDQQQALSDILIRLTPCHRALVATIAVVRLCEGLLIFRMLRTET